MNAVQALRMPFEMVSASEMNPKYRELCLENFSEHFNHFYPTVEEQVKCNTVGLLCKDSVSSLLGPCKPHESQIDLLFSGSPCNPFSAQRAKRFTEGDVKSHQEFSVTMQDVVASYQLYEPRIGVFEQVMGFTQPFSADDPTTPKDLFLD